MLAFFAPLLGPILDKVLSLIPDPAAQAKAKADAMAQILAIAAQADQAQMEVNKTEAASSSTFVAGWRPFIGWVCGAALAFQYIVRPIVTSVVLASGYNNFTLPGLDDNLWQLMTALLGLGGLRTYEKVAGITK